MKSNYWDGKNIADHIAQKHREETTKFDLPTWTKTIHCPYCNKTLMSSELRVIGMRLNARNIGDISVEFCCLGCSVMDTLYYRNACANTSEFIKIMNNEMALDTKPVVEAEMYKLSYNNLIEKIEG